MSSPETSTKPLHPAIGVYAQEVEAGTLTRREFLSAIGNPQMGQTYSA